LIMVLSWVFVGFLGHGRVGGCGVAGWWVRGRAGDISLMAAGDHREPVSVL
jgi:hypothetical protein